MEIGNIRVIRNVPKEALEEIIRDFKSEGAIEVTQELQEDGKYEIKAKFEGSDIPKYK